MAEKSNAVKLGCGFLIAASIAIVGFCAVFLPDRPREPDKPVTSAAIPSTETAPHQDEFSALIPNCTPGGGVNCTDDIYQKVWLRLEANNGEVTKVDTKSIQHVNTGAAEVVIYTYVPQTQYNPEKLRRLFFDCAGQYRDDTDGFSPVMDAPPNSIAGKVAAIACAGAKDTRLEDANR